MRQVDDEQRQEVGIPRGGRERGGKVRVDRLLREAIQQVLHRLHERAERLGRLRTPAARPRWWV